MLRSGDAKIVAVLVPDLDNPFFTSIVSAVEQRLGKDSYEVIVASSRGDELMERSKLKAILAWRPAGLIVIPCSDEFPSRDFIEASKTPHVIADRVTDNLTADTVSLDNEEAGRLAARHLIDLGHENILIAASSLSLANIRQRCEGAAEVFRSHGLPDPAIVELGFDIEAGSRKLSEWFNRHSPPTAIQALTNFTTLTALGDDRRTRPSHAGRHLVGRLRRLHLDARPRDAADRYRAAGARNGSHSLGTAERPNQGRRSRPPNMFCCRVNSSFATRRLRRAKHD